jgi:hypothetical protein
MMFEKIRFQKVTDLNQTFVTWQTKENLYGRFSVESACHIYDTDKNNTASYYLTSGVMACKVFEDENMISNPPYLFQGIFSKDEYYILRSSQGKANVKDTYGINNLGFLSLTIDAPLVSYQEIDYEQINSVLADNCYVQASQLLSDATTSQTYLLEFPVKHININNSSNQYQIETGPVIIPFPSHHGISSMQTAYIAANQMGDVNFILNKRNSNTYKEIIKTKGLTTLYNLTRT